MRRTFSGILVLVIAVVATAFLVNSGRTKAAAPHPPRDGWEYASMTVGDTGLVATTTPEFSVSGKTWGQTESLLTNGRGFPGPSSASTLVNILGQQGWELVTILKSSNGSTEWWFKRELPKAE
jgi:hypothetical protein